MKIEFDGYAFAGERLDGLFFFAEVGAEVGEVTISPDSDNRHWSEMDQPAWLGKAREYAVGLLREYGSARAIVDACEADEVADD